MTNRLGDVASYTVMTRGMTRDKIRLDIELRTWRGPYLGLGLAGVGAGFPAGVTAQVPACLHKLDRFLIHRVVGKMARHFMGVFRAE